MVLLRLLCALIHTDILCVLIGCVCVGGGDGCRVLLYKRGGVLIVTSHILVVDLLLHRLRAERVTGMVVLHAERYSTAEPQPWCLGGVFG